MKSMKFLTALHTDIGIKKDTNQDSMLLMQATTSAGEVVFAVVCDGMGGLKKGELASAEVVHAMAGWFRNEFPVMLQKGFDPVQLKDAWKRISEELDDRISRYGAGNGMRLGTTLVAFLGIEQQYYIINIGDSRIYQVEAQKLLQLTHDHTVVQREVDLGRMSLEEAERDSRRSILLQCIGASDYVEPDFFTGTMQPDQVYLLCCDGFRHVMSADDFCRNLNPNILRNEQGMNQMLVQLTEEIKRRRETDNISAILIRTCR